MSSIKKIKFENYKKCLEATKLENKLKYLEKNKINIDSRNHKYYFHIAFTEEINKIALSSNDDERMQSFDSIETHAYGMSKDLISEKEEIKCNSIIK